MSSLIITHWRALSVTVGLTLMPLALRAAEAPTDPFKVQQQAAQQLPDYLYTVDGLDVTAWQDQQPVLIKVPIYDEHHVWQGDSLYFFKAGQLTGVQMPYGRYEFNGKGRMIVWMNEQGQAEELPGSPAWGQRQGWLLRRAAQLLAAFVPGPLPKSLQETPDKVDRADPALAQKLCASQLRRMLGSERLELPAKLTKPRRGLISGAGRVQMENGKQALRFECKLDKDWRIRQLTYRLVGPLVH